MSEIRADIRERVALGPDEGQEFRLVEVTGSQHAGAKTAAGYVRRMEAGAEVVRDV